MFDLFKSKKNRYCGIDWLNVKPIELDDYYVNQVDEKGNTPLYYAALYCEDIWVFERLIDLGADMNHIRTQNLISKDIELVKLFKKHNAELDVFTIMSNVKTYEEFKSFIRIGMLENSSSDELDELFHCYLNTNQTEEDYRDRISDIDFYQIAEQLISLGAKLKNPSPLLFLKPQYYAGRTLEEIKNMYSDRDKMTLQLLKWGAKIKANFKGELSPFNLAAKYCDENIVQMFIDNGANPNDNYALLSAICTGNLDVVELLLKSGADPNIILKLEDLTPEAFENPEDIDFHNLKSLDEMPIIINKIKSPFEDDEFVTDLSALHLACCDIGASFWEFLPPQAKIVKLLIDYGANVNAMCKSVNYSYEYTPLDFVKKSEKLNGSTFRLTFEEDYHYDDKSNLIVDLDCKDEGEMLGKIIFLLDNKQANYHTSSRVLKER
jgi:ankyrin repeat protein